MDLICNNQQMKLNKKIWKLANIKLIISMMIASCKTKTYNMINIMIKIRMDAMVMRKKSVRVVKDSSN